MDEIRRILVFILSGLSAVSSLTGRGYYCRDPDTGKLHPSNSTWPATSFCGNYTCLLKRKLTFQSEPVRQLNVSNVDIPNIVNRNSENDGEFAASEVKPQILIEMPTNVDDKTLFQNELNNMPERLRQKVNLEGNDRFLTETEIKTISDMLHNVKKSDLEAIVDIYNLAQDIYKEMDKVTSENIVEETMRLVQNIKTDRSNTGHNSYWYDPVNRYHNAEVKPDLEHQATKQVPTTAQPKVLSNPETYFSGPLLRGDFGKLPYYYPTSNFQRQSSYVHPTYNPQTQPRLPPVNIKPPCSNKDLPPVAYPAPPVNNQSPPQYNQAPSHYNPPAQSYPAQSSPQNYGGVMKRPFTVETQKLIQPSMLLPYPFSYVQHYNMSAYPFNLYYAENPWTRFVSNNNNNSYITSLPQNTNNAILEADKKASKPKALEKTSILEGNLLESLLAKAKIHKPDWQTDPLPAKVLEEVRAHFEEKAKLLKPFSLRKKVKLEKVGKVVKLDDLHRKRRSIIETNNESIDNVDEFEAYIDKITCRSDMDPGFFRMGNLTEPYPACCPQRIEDEDRR